MSDWKQLYQEVSELAPPARLGHRINELGGAAPAPTRASAMWAAATRNRGRAAELVAATIAIAVLVVAIHGYGGSGHAPVGGGMVRIPKKGNTDASRFLPRLHRLGLRIAIPTPWRTSSFSALFFTITSPASGTRVPRGSVVTLQTGLLPGIPWSNTGNHVVPNVLNATLDKATARISAAGLPWLVHANALPPTLTANLFGSYCVTSQMPTAGARVTTHEGSTKLHQVELHAKPC